MFLYLWGDIAHDPEINCIICKTRPLNNDSVIIQKLEIDRHWIYLSKIKQSDINYKDKINKYIGRSERQDIEEEEDQDILLF